MLNVKIIKGINFATTTQFSDRKSGDVMIELVSGGIQTFQADQTVKANDKNWLAQKSANSNTKNMVVVL